MNLKLKYQQCMRVSKVKDGSVSHPRYLFGGAVLFLGRGWWRLKLNFIWTAIRDINLQVLRIMAKALFSTSLTSIDPKQDGFESLCCRVKHAGYIISVSQFEHQSRNYVDFWINILGKGTNPLFPPAMGWIVLLLFNKDGFGSK